MAAVVEHPTSAFSDRQGPIQQPPRMSSLEIIDVEEYLQEAQASNAGISSSQPTRPTPRPILRNSGRQQETIYIDSDDDEPVITFSRVLSGHEANGQRSHRRLISPPPRSSSGSVPPVPPIPGPFAGHTAFPPMRRNPPAFPQPPVVANESLDIEFLSDLPVAGPSAFTSRVVHRRGTGAGPPGPPPLPAAPASHHTPSMGLGGALISSNSARARQEAQDARIAARIARQRQAGRAPVIRGLPAPPYLFHEDGRAQVRSVWGLGHFSSLGWPFSGPSSGKEKEMYNSSYTHPGQPEPGFTFDFSVSEDAPRRPGFPATSIHAPIVIDDSDDEPSSSDRPVVIDVDSVPAKTTAATTTSMAGSKTATSGTGELSALLVCARCCDPLILNAAMDPEEGYYRRVWALRCGHMIDEKCLNEIGQPPEARLVQMEMEEMVNEKEKEKEKEEEQEPKMEKKGKGKAKARTTAMSSDTVPEVKEAEDNNIRARLRSRNPTVGASSTPPSSITATIAPSTTTTTTTSSTVAMASSTASSSSSSTTTSINHPASKRRRVGPKSRRPPHVEDEYVWTCPVASCGRVHASVKVDGIWCPEKEGFVGPEGAMRAVQEGREIVPRGVIAVFA